jgi:hypothetical protein
MYEAKVLQKNLGGKTVVDLTDRGQDGKGYGGKKNISIDQTYQEGGLCHHKLTYTFQVGSQKQTFSFEGDEPDCSESSMEHFLAQAKNGLTQFREAIESALKAIQIFS